MCEGGAELGELGVEVFDLRLGDCRRELGVRSFRLFLSVKGSETCASSVHLWMSAGVSVIAYWCANQNLRPDYYPILFDQISNTSFVLGNTRSVKYQRHCLAMETHCPIGRRFAS